MAEVLFFSLKDDLPFLEKIKKGIEDHFDFIAANEKLPNFIFNEIMQDIKLREVFSNILKDKVLQVLQDLKVEIDNEMK